MGSSRRCLIFGLIILVAAVFRLTRITGESLWADEILTVRSATAPFTRVIGVVRQIENAPPLYFVLMNRWVAVFGDSDFSLRLPSALAGIAAVVVMARLGQLLFNNVAPGAGLWSAAMLAVQPYHIAYSMEARPYALMFLLAAWSCEALAVLLRGTSRWAQLGYVLASAGMLWTHTMAGFVLIAQNVVILPLLARRMREGTGGLNLRRWMVLQGAVLVLMIPWIGDIRTVWSAGAPWIGPVTVLNVLQTHAGGMVLLIAWLALAAIATVFAWKQGWPIGFWLSASLWIVPIVLPELMSMLHKPFLIPRYALPALIGIHLLCGYAAAGIAPSKRWIGSTLGIAVLAAGLLVSFPLLLSGHTLQQHNRPDIRSAALEVSRQAESGDAVYVVSFSDTVFDHYMRRSDVARVIYSTLPERLENAPPRVWVVSWLDQPPGTIQSYELEKTSSYGGIRLQLFRRR